MSLDTDRQDMFYAAADGATVPYSSAPKSFPLPLAMGGYKIGPAAPDSLALREFGKYLKEAAELKQALAENAARPDGNPYLDGFARMIEKVRHISDPLVQIQIVNAYVNLIDFDCETRDSAEKNTDHPSMTQELIRNKAICTNASALKMFALLEAGFAPDDIQWLAEVCYERLVSPKRLAPQNISHAIMLAGKELTLHNIGRAITLMQKGLVYQDIGHAITLARIGSKIWALNIDKPYLSPGTISPTEAGKLAINASRIETDVTHLNFSHSSRWWPKRICLAPSFAFAANQALDYDVNKPLWDLSNVPEVARNTPAQNCCLSTDDLRRYDVLEILAPVMSQNYKITDIAPPELPAFIDRKPKAQQASQFALI